MPVFAPIRAGVSRSVHSMRTRFLALLVAMFLAISCAAPERASPPDRVLFVGNSLTYVGNVPAVFSALAEANGTPMPSDMIVKGGATLSERVADGSVARCTTCPAWTS